MTNKSRSKFKKNTHKTSETPKIQEKQHIKGQNKLNILNAKWDIAVDSLQNLPISVPTDRQFSIAYT